MNFIYQTSNAFPNEPAIEPDQPDTPHPLEPDPMEPERYPVIDPAPPVDPGIEPIREPEPAPPFPEPIPGTPPDVVI
jgi:hypothetical protein